MSADEIKRFSIRYYYVPTYVRKEAREMATENKTTDEIKRLLAEGYIGHFWERQPHKPAVLYHPETWNRLTVQYSALSATTEYPGDPELVITRNGNQVTVKAVRREET